MIILDYRDKRPIYEQVTEKIQAMIVRGVLEPDSKLPSVRNLAMELSINPNTIQRAYVELEQLGYIYTVKGRGNYVSRESEWLEGKQKLVYAEARLLAEHAMEVRIPAKDLVTRIEGYYEEGRA